MKITYRSFRHLMMLSVILTLVACSNMSNPVRSIPEEPDMPEPQELEIPTVHVLTVNGEMPTCDLITAPEGCMGQSITNATKVGARMTIVKNKETLYDSGDYVEGINGITIRIRGNSSAWKDQRGYKIKLQQATDLLLRGKEDIYHDKDWLLINDETRMLNTMIGLKVNELIGMPWTPRFQFVNLSFNGQSQGLYLLIESVKRNKRCRINVSNSGYIIEYDPYWWNENLWFETLMTTSYDAKFTFKYPDIGGIQPTQIDYIRDFVNKFDDGLVNKNHFAEYIDTVSFASWLLAQDILGNYDAHGSNIFFTKYDDTSDSKLMMGCLWDFDAIMMTTDAWSNSHRLAYFVRLISNSTDRSFANAYRQRWEEIKDTLFTTLKEYIEAFSISEEGQAFDRAITADNKLWGRRCPNLRQLTDEALAWFEKRKLWMDAAIQNEIY